MRKLKDGTIKYKKAALEAAAWMNQPPNPLPVFRKGETVQVYRGSGWSKGKVVMSSPKGCQVRLSMPDRTVSVYDARCIKPYSDK